jgi:hypothetical protein
VFPDEDERKAAARRRILKCPHGVAEDAADSSEKREREFAMAEIKKAAKKLPQSKKPALLPTK